MSVRYRLLQISFLLIVAGAGLVFVWGFVLGTRGDVGEPVSFDDSGSAREIPLQPEAERVVVIGDSLARGAGDPTGRGIGRNLETILKRKGRKVEWYLNMGVDGARTLDVLERLEPAGTRRMLADASIVVVSIGANDIFHESGRGGTLVDVDPEEILGRVEKVVAEIRAMNQDALIYLVGLYNPFPESPESGEVSRAVAKWNSEIVDRTSSDPRLIVVPTADLFRFEDRLSADRFHPGAEAYELIAERIGQTLR